MTEWRREGREVARIERIDVEEVPGCDDLQLLDVREQSERDEVHVPGSLFEPGTTSTRPRGPGSRAARGRDVRLGERAAVAASLVQRLGAKHVVHVVGGGVRQLESRLR